MIYLDWNATAPPLPAVIDAMADAAREAWGNPSSVHAVGRAARARVEGARAAVAELAGVDPRDVLFTSGGTEANNLALRSAFPVRGEGTLVTSRLEHPSVVRVAEALADEGVHVRWLAVKPEGRIDLDDLGRALGERSGRMLVALQAVNGETGIVQPVDEAIAMARARTGGETLVHVDAVQAFGRFPGSFAGGADSRSVAAHKFRGPKSIGALVTRPGLKVFPVLLGGSQERGLRPGTVDPVCAAGFAVAATHARTSPARYAAVEARRDAFERAILDAIPGARVNGEGRRAPHVTNLSFPGWIGAELVAALDLEGVCVSSGSACSAGTIEPSKVITAMVGEARASSAVRFSMGEETSGEELRAARAALSAVVARR